MSTRIPSTLLGRRLRDVDPGSGLGKLLVTDAPRRLSPDALTEAASSYAALGGTLSAAEQHLLQRVYSLLSAGPASGREDALEWMRTLVDARPERRAPVVVTVYPFSAHRSPRVVGAAAGAAAVGEALGWTAEGPAEVRGQPVLSRDGAHVYVVDHAGRVQRLARAGGAAEVLLELGLPCHTTPALSPDGRTLVVAAGERSDAALVALDLDTGEVAWRSPLARAGARSSQFSSPTFSPDGSRVFVGEPEGRLCAFRTSDGRELWRAGETGRPPGYMSPVVSPDGDTVCFGDSTGGVFAVDADSGELLWPNPARRDGNANGSAVITADGELLVVPGGQRLHAFALDTGEERWSVPINLSSGQSPTLSPDGSEILIPSTDGRLYVLDAQTGEPAWVSEKNPNHWHLVASSAVSADGRKFIALDGGGHYVLFDRDSREIRVAEGGTQGPGMGGFAVSPDGRTAYRGHLQAGGVTAAILSDALG